MLTESDTGAGDAVEGLAPGAAATSGLRTMTKRSMLFAAGAIAGKVVGLIMLPVLTRLLTPAELGNLDVLMVLVNALITALLLGLDVAALRLYFDQPTEAAQRSLLSTWYVIALGITTSAALFLVLISGVLGDALFSTTRLQPAIVAAAVAIVAGTVEVIVLTILRARGRAGWYALVNVGTLALYAILATILLTTWRADAAAVLWGWAVALLISAVVGTFILRRDLLGRPSRGATRMLLRLGLPLAPAVLATLVSEFLIRIILLRSAGPEQVAFFTVGNRFASVAALSLAVLQLAWVPRAYALGGALTSRARIGSEATWIVATVCTAVLVVAGGAREIVTVAAGSTYLAALPALGFSLVAVIGAAVYLVASMPSAVGRRTEDLAIATGVAAVIGVVGTFLVAGTWQATGTSAALAVGQLAAVVVVGLLSTRRPSLHIEWARLLVMGGVSCGATILMIAVEPLLLRAAIAALAMGIIALSVRVREGMAIARGVLHR
jgi:O-antigen/teichoic acid export membrane protein